MMLEAKDQQSQVVADNWLVCLHKGHISCTIYTNDLSLRSLCSHCDRSTDNDDNKPTSDVLILFFLQKTFLVHLS